jgi:ssDNA-binding Zn-finger/Zn-ribbon topoisomerase 1
MKDPNISPRTGKPKRAPRGRPFNKNADPRRSGLAARAIGETCPACIARGNANPGTLQQRAGKFGAFIGCTAYPLCTYTQQMRATPTEPTPTPTAFAPTPTTEPSAEPTAEPNVMMWRICEDCGASTLAEGNAPTVLCTTCETKRATPEPFEPEPMTTPAAPARPGSIDAIIADIARAAAAESVNETRVNEIVNAALAAHADSITSNISDIVANGLAAMQNAAPQNITHSISINGAEPVAVNGAMHKALPRVIALAKAGFNILIVGPAGAGKTYLGEQLAEVLGREFRTASCAPGLPESALIGRNIPNLTTGAETYRQSEFVRLYRDGGVFLLDEVDNADASTLLILNSALANGHMTIPSGDRIERHPNFVLIASANTYGHGQDRQYVGRTQLDAAFLDRFVGATLTLDYDPDLERQLCPELALREKVQDIRAKARALPNFRRIVSTRALIAARKLVYELGDSIPAAMLAISEGWTREDRQAVGIELPTASA